MKVPLRRIPKLLLAQVYTRNALVQSLITRFPERRLDRPIFILGLPRSGTSIFCTLFGENRHVAHWSEAPVVWDPRWRDREQDHRWTAAHATPENLRRINNNFAYYTKLKGQTRFVNKHPRNALRVPFLMAGWPDARLIHVRRDPRAVANSLITITRAEKHRQRYPLGQFARPEGWREINALPDDVERFSRMVLGIDETLTEDLKAVPAERLFEIRYEDFAADVHGSLRRAWGFSELPVDEGALRRVPERLENRNYKWAKTRTPQEQATMHRILGDLVVARGYEPDVHWLDRARAAATAGV